MLEDGHERTVHGRQRIEDEVLRLDPVEVEELEPEFELRGQINRSLVGVDVAFLQGKQC